MSLSAIIKFLGRKAYFWLAISALSGSTVALTDFGFTAILSVLLRSLGLTTSESESSSWLVNWQPSVEQFLLILLLIGILRGVSQFWVFQSTDLVYDTINTRLRLLSLQEILGKSSQKFVSAADTHSRIGEIYPQAAMFCFQMSMILAFIIQGIVLLLCMLFIAWKEAIIGLIGLSFIGLLVLKINKKARLVAKQITSEQKDMVTSIERIARNWLFIKIMRTQGQEYKHLVHKVVNYSSHFVRARFLGNLGAVSPLVLGIFLLILIILVNLKVWHTPAVNVVGCIYLFGRFLSVAGRVARGFGMMSSSFPHFQIAVSYLHNFSAVELKQAVIPMQNLSNLKESISSQDNINYQKTSDKYMGEIKNLRPPKISLKNVSFAYSTETPFVLNNISLTINPGEQFGFVGKSGSGKSTLIGLILGVLEPMEGKITIEELTPNEFFQQSSTHIGYVGAEPFLIEGTIKNNLDYGSDKSYSPEEYRQSLASANLLEVIDNLPKGLDYFITENSEGLSAGQKQRLALARALLKQPQILVLDEVSANLDDETEAKIALSIKELKGLCTIIIVSHRPGILIFCDQIREL